MQIRRSFKSTIEKSTKTEAQEKNHTDPIDLFSRTPLGQLMRRAVKYTHQRRADGTNAPRPSRKKFSLFLGSPCTVELHLSGRWLSGLPISRIDLAFWANIFLL
jgi:hypothetical protein